MSPLSRGRAGSETRVKIRLVRNGQVSVRKTNLGGAVLLGAALIVLLSAIFIVRNDEEQYAVMTARSDHFKAITDLTQAALSALKDAETGQRGYVITSNRSYLEPYSQGIRDYRESIDRLTALSRGDTLALNINEFMNSGNEKIAELAHVIELYDHGDRAGAIAIIDAGIGKDLMDRARALSARAVEQSEMAFAANNQEVAAAVRIARYRLFFAAGLLFCLTSGGTLLLTYEIRRTAALAHGLEVSEKRYRELSASLEQQVAERTRHLETVNKALDAFSYSVSHDLRAPLRSIDGFSVMVLEDYSDRLDDAGRDMLKRIRAAASRMGKLIQSLLEMSRLSAGELHKERVSVSSLARSIVDELRAASPEHASDIRIAPELYTTTDPVILRVILENLLSNAWKFSSRNQQIRIEVGTTTVEGNQAFFVRDEGAGFDPQYEERLFTPFQRLHSSNDYEGTGIGLATVHRAVLRLGGRVWAESQPGRGATFFFNLG